MTLKNRYKESIRPKLLKDLGLKNIHQVPKVVKVNVNRGLGEAASNSKALEASLHASNVMFFSKDKNLTSKIEYFIDKEGVKKRRLKKTGEVID